MAAASLLLLAASVAAFQSAAADVQPVDRVAVAEVMADQLAQELPPAATTLVLAPSRGGRAERAFSELLVARVRARGFALARADQAAGPAVLVRYQASSDPAGATIVLTFNGEQTARVLRRYAGDVLLPLGAPSVRQVQ